MTTAWLLEAVGLLATTIGALLILLHLLSPSPFTAEFRTGEAKRAYEAHRQRLVIAVAVLCLWLLIQDVGILLL